MGLLSQDMIHELVEAACDVPLSCETLLETLPKAVSSTLPTGAGRPPAEHLLIVLCRLNDWELRTGGPLPLTQFLQTAQFLSRARGEAGVFKKAIEELGEKGAKTASNCAPGDVFVRRAKQSYESHGYSTAPYDGDDPSTFVAWRESSMISVISVAVGSVETAINSARRAVDKLRDDEPFVEGCVVLLYASGETGQLKVRNSNLRPIPYADLKPIGFEEFSRLVLNQQAAIYSGDRGSDTEAPLEPRLRAFLKDNQYRVFFVNMQNQEQAKAAHNRIFKLCADNFEEGLGNPAPISLLLEARSLRDLVGDAFRYHEVRYSPIGLPRWLEEGALLPIFTADCREDTRGGDLRAVKEAIDDKSTSKVVLIGRGLDAEGLKRRLRAPVMCASKIA